MGPGTPGIDLKSKKKICLKKIFIKIRFFPPQGPENGPRDPGDRFKIKKKMLIFFTPWGALGPPRGGPGGRSPPGKGKGPIFNFINIPKNGVTGRLIAIELLLRLIAKSSLMRIPKSEKNIKIVFLNG